jgi:CHAT domain
MCRKNVWNPNVRFDNSVQNPSFRVHHYACHCDTSSDDPDQHRIILKGNRHNVFEITLHDLYESLAESMGNDCDPRARPLVFLNACSSAKVVPSGSLSFPGFFTRNSFVGFIGTEIPIRDEWAANFSQIFYGLLLDGETVGEAAYKAKWLLLQRKGNPSGIFYVLYADPFMQLVPRSQS